MKSLLLLYKLASSTKNRNKITNDKYISTNKIGYYCQ